MSNHGDADLFSFLSAMHLDHPQIPGTQQLITSRKRKILDHGDRGSLGGSSSGKFNGLRPPLEAAPRPTAPTPHGIADGKP